ncbi:cryptochrome/photolyase family protein [Thiomicrorhabdus aquaedulcis]|uniref:cryptochrome/photolyase family protein n=1 Tax=Thiomicrorhabdus aquaedulcis TaxID=2211106 RepID=UPI000FDB8E06|nr:deoxyribodipyrimidine photo-lyase [Thiomicrorhabdus aquaedulcis]
MEKQALLEPLDVFNPSDFSAERCMLAPPKHSALPTDLDHLLQTPWAQKVLSHWNQHAISEAGAWQALDYFVEHHLTDYPHDRDFMALAASSKLSPYLHFGQLCPRMVYFYLEDYKAQPNRTSAQIDSAQAWLRQLVWKEFARHLLFWFASSQFEPFMLKYQSMPWQAANADTLAWQKGLTGYPLIDAGMRELWATGTMHNRVRMLVASFLTKNLNQSWLVGKAWFEHTLLDADPANNVMGWQWVAGCGVDASPYYRLFNPITQSEKFDPKGDYIKTWLPELNALSAKAIHAPWLHVAECTLKGITLGTTYPLPLVDLKTSREAHMERVQSLKAAVWITKKGTEQL